MNTGMNIEAHQNNVYVTPSSDEERDVLITMYTRVAVNPKVVVNTYIFSKVDWDRIIEASGKV